MNSRFTRTVFVCLCVSTPSLWAQTSPDLDQFKAKMAQLQQMMEDLKAQMAVAEKGQPSGANAPAPAASKAPGMGRIVRPIKNHAANIEAILQDPAFSHLYFDISWDEVAKYIIASPQATQITADLINRYPDRFLFGTDEVAPSTWATYSRVFNMYQPLWNLLRPKTSLKVRCGNYERIFDVGRRDVRQWEAAHISTAAPAASSAASAR